MQDKFSKIGFILAVAGSAVGLGNAWKFPYLVGQNGGSAFVLLYLFMTFFIGLAIFFGEIAIGKLSESDPVNAFKKLAPKRKEAWKFAGFTMTGAIIIASFYTVIIGWILKYAVMVITEWPPSEFSEIFTLTAPRLKFFTSRSCFFSAFLSYQRA